MLNNENFAIKMQKDGSIHYQTTTTEYDTTGNVIAQNDKIDADRTARQYVGRAWPFGTPIYAWKPIRERMGKRTYRNGAWSSLKYVDKRFYQYA